MSSFLVTKYLIYLVGKKVDENNQENIEAKQRETDAANKLADALIKKLIPSIDQTTKAEKAEAEALEARKKALQENIDYLKKQSEALNTLASGTVNATKTFTSALDNSARTFTKWNGALDAAGDAAMALGKQFGPLGVAVGATVGIFTKLATSLVEMKQRQIDAYDSIAKMGSGASITTQELTELGHKSGYTTAQLGEFTKTLSTLGPRLTQLGGSVDGGIRAFAKLTDSTNKEQQEAVDKYRRLGFNQTEYNQMQADLIDTLGKTGHSLESITKGAADPVKALRDASNSYLDNLIQLANMTGKSVEEQRKSMEASAANASLQLYFAGQDKKARDLEAQAQATTNQAEKERLMSQAKAIRDHDDALTGAISVVKDKINPQQLATLQRAMASGQIFGAGAAQLRLQVPGIDKMVADVRSGNMNQQQFLEQFTNSQREFFSSKTGQALISASEGTQAQYGIDAAGQVVAQAIANSPEVVKKQQEEAAKKLEQGGTANIGTSAPESGEAARDPLLQSAVDLQNASLKLGTFLDQHRLVIYALTAAIAGLALAVAASRLKGANALQDVLGNLGKLGKGGGGGAAAEGAEALGGAAKAAEGAEALGGAAKAAEGLGGAAKAAEGLGGAATAAEGLGAAGIGAKAAGMFGKLGRFGGLLKGAGRLAGKAALPLALLTSAYDAYEGATHAEDIMGLKKGETATTGQKFAAGAGSIISGLTFGLADTKSVSKGLYNFFGGNNAVTGAKPEGTSTTANKLSEMIATMNVNTMNVSTLNLEGVKSEGSTAKAVPSQGVQAASMLTTLQKLTESISKLSDDLEQDTTLEGDYDLNPNVAPPVMPNMPGVGRGINGFGPSGGMIPRGFPGTPTIPYAPPGSPAADPSGRNQTGTEAGVKPDVLSKKQQLENVLGKKLIVTSGVRPGVANHGDGSAIDLGLASNNLSDAERNTLFSTAIGLGFTGLGAEFRAPGGPHIHLDTSHNQLVGWGSDYTYRSLPNDSPYLSKLINEKRNGGGNLPKMAMGGITNGVSIAGEAGREAIVPLPGGRAIPVEFKHPAAAASEPISKTTGNMTASPDMSKVIQELVNTNKDLVNTMGTKLDRMIDHLDKSNTLQGKLVKYAH